MGVDTCNTPNAIDTPGGDHASKPLISIMVFLIVRIEGIEGTAKPLICLLALLCLLCVQ
jgi:hypothetical protein